MTLHKITFKEIQDDSNKFKLVTQEDFTNEIHARDRFNEAVKLSLHSASPVSITWSCGRTIHATFSIR